MSNTEDSSQYNIDFLERNEQTLNDIDNLQQLEKKFYKKLSEKLTDKQRKNIMSKIDQVHTMRMGIYKNLQNSYAFYDQNIETTENLLNDQMAAIKLVEKELDKMKASIRTTNVEKNNQIRLAEISTYYGKQYSSHSKLMIIIILMCLPIILISILTNKGVLSVNIANTLVSVILVIGGVFLIYQLSDIFNRDNMNYDEYDWHFDKDKAPSID